MDRFFSILLQITRLTDGQTEFSSLDSVCISCSAVKSAVYANVNGDIVSYTSTIAQIKKVIIPSNISPNVNVLLSNITFFDFCWARRVGQTRYVAVNVCINCSFLHL